MNHHSEYNITLAECCVADMGFDGMTGLMHTNVVPELVGTRDLQELLEVKNTFQGFH